MSLHQLKPRDRKTSTIKITPTVKLPWHLCLKSNRFSWLHHAIRTLYENLTSDSGSTNESFIVKALTSQNLPFNMNSLMIVRVIQLKIQLTWKSWNFNSITGASTGCDHLLPRLVPICPLASRQDKSMADDGQVQTGRTSPDLSPSPSSLAATPWPSFSFPSSSRLKGGKDTRQPMPK